MDFVGVGSHPAIHNNKLLTTFPMIEREKYSPWYPQEMKPLGYWHVRPYIRPTCYPADSRGESIIRLSLGTLWVNLLQVDLTFARNLKTNKEQHPIDNVYK